MAQQVEFSVSGPELTATFTRDASTELWLGRDADCHVVLPTLSVSRKHVSVTAVPGGIQLVDASTNGTLVDGQLLKGATRVRLAAGVELRLGHYRVAIRVSPSHQVIQGDGAPSGQSGLDQEPSPKLEKSWGRGPSVEVRRRIHRQLLEHLDLGAMGGGALDAVGMRPKVVAALRRIIADICERPEANLKSAEQREALVRELTNEALGLGPLEDLLADPEVNEIMVVDPQTIFVERAGRLSLSGLAFTDDSAVRATIERIVTPLGRRIDESTPLVDARLRDGSRVNAVIPPLALRGPCITIRKFSANPLRMSDLVRFGSLSPEMARFLENSVAAKRNIVISGGTGSGKTTLLNVLSAAIPESERVVTVEDAAELQLSQNHVVSLESRPPNLEGKGEYSIRDLVKNALRMRPDRIVVGECRGGEAIDMLQAMNTGHEGSLTTTHANSPSEAVARIETLCLMAGLPLPIAAIRRQIASSLHLIVQQTRFSDGTRRVASIAEVTGLSDEGEVEIQEIYRFDLGEKTYLATGYLPTFTDRLLQLGPLAGDQVL